MSDIRVPLEDLSYVARDGDYIGAAEVHVVRRQTVPELEEENARLLAHVADLERRLQEAEARGCCNC